MTITGGTQVIGIILSIVRMKVLALLLGPAGVGILSLYNSLQSTGTLLGALGLGNSGAREIAKSNHDTKRLSRVRRVLLGANIFQGILSMIAIWVLRDRISLWLFGRPGFEAETGLIGIAVFLAVIAGSQSALLRGLRRIADLGRITVFVASAVTVSGIAAIYLFGIEGLIVFVLVQPLAQVFFTFWFTRRLPKPVKVNLSSTEIWAVWIPMVKLGIAFMLGGLSLTLALLFVRAVIADELGLRAAGQFAAAWGISTIYVGFLLNAMAMDYYPSLTEIIDDKNASNLLINEQFQIVMAIGGPILLLMIGFAPLIITVLYSSEFDASIVILQWQTAGNVLKLASWPLGFVFGAAAQSRTFLITQIFWSVCYACFIWFGLPYIGVEVTGIAFLVGYIVYYFVVWLIVRRNYGFRWSRVSLQLFALHGLSTLLLLPIALWFPLAGAVFGFLFGTATGFIGGHILLERLGPSRYTAPLVKFYGALRWPVVWKS